MRVPRQLVIETSLRCQLKCLGCPSVDSSIKEYGNYGFMEVDFYKSLIDRIKKENMNTSATICMNGESLLHPDIYELCRYTAEKEVAFYTTTNTMIWNEKLFDFITRRNSCYQLIMSCNGLWDYRSKSIETCMPGINRQISRKNIERLLDMKVRNGNNIQVGIKICRRTQDQEELEHLIAYWLNSGADFVIIGRMLTSFSGGTRLFPCRHFDDMAMYVRFDGTVIPCSFNVHMCNEHEYDMGILDKDCSLVEFYNNEKFVELRRLHYTGKFPKWCAQCNVAYTGDGFEGELRFRNPELSRKTVYFHDDYSNTFYSFNPKKTRVSYLRSWEPDYELIQKIQEDGELINFSV